MRQTRIKETSVDGYSYFFPQYLGWFKKWRNFKNYQPYYSADFCFKTLAEAKDFLNKVNHKPVVNVLIHNDPLIKSDSKE